MGTGIYWDCVASVFGISATRLHGVIYYKTNMYIWQVAGESSFYVELWKYFNDDDDDDDNNDDDDDDDDNNNNNNNKNETSFLVMSFQHVRGFTQSLQIPLPSPPFPKYLYLTYFISNCCTKLVFTLLHVSATYCSHDQAATILKI